MQGPVEHVGSTIPGELGLTGLSVPTSEQMEELQERQDDLGDVAAWMKEQATPYDLRYIIYEVAKDRHHQVEKIGDRSKTWSDFVDDLPEDECRIACVDVDLKTQNDADASEIVYVWWNPHSAKVRSRVLYGEKHNADMSHLDGKILYFHRADDKESLAWEKILGIVQDYEDNKNNNDDDEEDEGF